MAIAYGAGIFAFDFDTSMPIRTRDLLFNIHRLAGVLTGVLALLWMGVWSVGAIRSAAYGRVHVRVNWLGLYHAGLLIIGFVIPLLPWLARGQEGRWDELYVLVSPFNLVSHPTTDFAYWLLDKHKALVELMAYLLALHILGALHHALFRKDRVWAGMFSLKR